MNKLMGITSLNFINANQGNNMREKLMEVIIEVQDVAVELEDRMENDFDELLVNRLKDAVKLLEDLHEEAI